MVNDNMADGIKKETIMQMQRERKISDLEDLDSHNARLAKLAVDANAAKASGGRPRRAKSVLMADIAHCMRCRAEVVGNTWTHAEETRKMSWAGHIMRRSAARWTKQVLQWPQEGWAPY